MRVYVGWDNEHLASYYLDMYLFTGQQRLAVISCHVVLFLPSREKNEVRTQREKWVQLSFCMEIGFLFFCFFFTKETMRTWDWSLSCFAQQTDSHSQSSACLFLSDTFFCFCVVVVFFTKLILHRRLKVFATCIQTHKTLHFDNISWTSQHYMRLACTSQVINMSNTSFRWMNDTWWGHCPLYLPFIPLLPFFYLCYTFPFFLSFFPFNVYIPLNSVCSFYWLLWNR